MATKRRTFCVETHKPDYIAGTDAVSRRCGFTYAQAESAARRATMVRGTSVAHVVSSGGRFAASCFRHSASYGPARGRIECRKTPQRTIANYRLADMIEGDPMAYIRRKD